jgi:hypothetical protein
MEKVIIVCFVISLVNLKTVNDLNDPDDLL